MIWRCIQNIEGKSIAGEEFIGNLKVKIYKYMTSVTKNDKLDDILILILIN